LPPQTLGSQAGGIGPDDDRGQKSLKLNDVGDSFGAAHEPVAESREVFIREWSEGRHGRRQVVSSFAATA
jgi:hypothetical protein